MPDPIAAARLGASPGAAVGVSIVAVIAGFTCIHAPVTAALGQAIGRAPVGVV